MASASKRPISLSPAQDGTGTGFWALPGTDARALLVSHSEILSGDDRALQMMSLSSTAMGNWKGQKSFCNGFPGLRAYPRSTVNAPLFSTSRLGMVLHGTIYHRSTILECPNLAVVPTTFGLKPSRSWEEAGFIPEGHTANGAGSGGCRRRASAWRRVWQ